MDLANLETRSTLWRYVMPKQRLSKFDREAILNRTGKAAGYGMGTMESQ